jgi:Na+-driven multidrug efflux pump
MDPILIFGLGPIPALGLKGAAIAALFARVVYVVGMMWVLLSRFHALARLSFNPTRLRDTWGSLLHIGVPATATQMVQPISTAILTKVVALSSTAAVTVVGGQALVGLFAKTPEVAALALFYVRVLALSYTLGGMVLISSQAMNAMRRPLPATFISMARAMGVTVPCALAGHWIAGVHGVFAGIAIGAALCGVAAWIVLAQIIDQETRRLGQSGQRFNWLFKHEVVGN